MMDLLRRVASGSALFALLFVATPSQATMLDIGFVGTVSMCSDSSLNRSVNLSFSTSGESSGGYTTINVNLGGEIGSFDVQVPSSEIDKIIQSVSAAGGSLQVPYGPEPLGGEYGCQIQGTLTISVQGNGEVGPNAPGTSVSASVGLSNFLRTELPAISGRVSSAFRQSESGFAKNGNVYSVNGMAAGDGERPPIGVWAGYSYVDSKSDFSSVAFGSDRHTLMVGLDTMPSDNLLLGVTVSYERTEVDTYFNGGEQSIRGFSVTPYLGLQLADWLTLDAAAGIGYLSTDQYRLAGTNRVNSDVSSTRIFGNVNATGSWAFDKLLATGFTGISYASQGDDSFFESNGTSISSFRTSVGRFTVGGELAYMMGAWEPYVSGTFEYDFSRSSVAFAPGVAQPGYDAADVLVAAGLRYFGDDDISAALEYNTVRGRGHFSEHSFNATVRWQF